MRPIKFRAWDGQQMINDWLVMQEEKTQVVVTQRSVAGLVPMQFTGLKDKNGKGIYEGDYVKCRAEHPVGMKWEPEGVVVWENGRYHFQNMGLDNAMVQTLEVIGNIYENPELLNP